jgi:nitrile hydratase subunit beta
MDGVHDLGGMHGFGAVPIEVDEPHFHAPWEARVWAMARTVRFPLTTDKFRWTIEQMPPGEYLTSRYYERWLWALERLTAERDASGEEAGASGPPTPSPSISTWEGRFRPGQRVRVRHVTTAGHTRVPRYLRRHEGTVQRVACAWPNPGESAATGTYGEPELVYTVAFAAADLFGPDADHLITADLGETDLETM